MCKPVVVSICFCVATGALNPCRAENQVYDVLLSKGVTIRPHETVRLMPPTLADGFDRTQQRRAVEAISNGDHSWEDLTRRSVVAPFILKISTEGDSLPRSCCRVDVSFVAYGTLRGVRDIRFLQSQMKASGNEVESENGVTTKPLTEAELARRGLKPPRGADEPRYFADELRLLGRVRLSMTTSAATSETRESILSASVLDTRFANDPQFPNLWRTVSRNESGRRVLGEPQPYSGYGGYAKATKLIVPVGAIFVEYHLVFAEPESWFEGSNSLRSKLPLVAQYLVREIRRELEKTP
jgi:hypothetical protein